MINADAIENGNPQNLRMLGGLLRLSFHDCVSDQCDGCINLNNHHNDGKNQYDQMHNNPQAKRAHLSYIYELAQNRGMRTEFIQTISVRTMTLSVIKGVRGGIDI